MGNQEDNNPLMFFVRSSPFFPEKYKPAQEAYDSSKLDAMAAGIANGAEITLPADINPDKFLDIIPEYPGMLRDASPNKVIKYTPKNHEKDLVEQYNVIVLILESFRDYETHSPFGEDITPNLNYWSKKGARYTSFYSTNRVTVKSETAILCGVMDSQNNDHLFVRNHNFSAKCLPSIFSSNGYETLWFHGNTKKFFDRNEYIPALGYSKVFGREEFLKEGYDDKHDLGWGIPDEIVFDWALEKLIKVNKPFFAEVLSLS